MINSKTYSTEAYLLGFISIAAFAATLPLAKNLVGDLSGLQIGIYRSFIAALVALPIVLLAKLSFPSRSQIKKLYITSIGIIYGFPILTAVGMQYVPISHGGVVLAAAPICTSIFSVIITGQKQSLKFWFLATLGLLIVSGYVVYSSEDFYFYMGDIALIGAAILAGLGYAQGGALSSEMSGWKVMCWVLVLNLPVLLVFSFLIFEPTDTDLTAVGWSSILFLALVNSLIGFFSWNRALTLGGIAKISQLQLLQVFITFGYAVFFFNEIWDWVTVTAFTLIVLIVYLSKRS